MFPWYVRNWITLAAAALSRQKGERNSLLIIFHLGAGEGKQTRKWPSMTGRIWEKDTGRGILREWFEGAKAKKVEHPTFSVVESECQRSTRVSKGEKFSNSWDGGRMQRWDHSMETFTIIYFSKANHNTSSYIDVPIEVLIWIQQILEK